jgi:hypothetical protein
MDYLARYCAGEHKQVTRELTRLGPCFGDLRAEAWDVAQAAMSRVAYNCHLIAERLRSRGYVFSVYCDPDDDGGLQPPISAFSERGAEALDGLVARFGSLPITLECFWRTIGDVAFTGTHPDYPEMLDPLVVHPVEALLEEAEYAEREDDGLYHFALSPDDLHKDNVSGGMPYSVALPQGTFDFRLMHEARDVDFLDYLRDVILVRGGFGGLDTDNPGNVPLAELTAGLQPF